MKTPSRIRPPTLGERLGRLLPAAAVPGGLAVEATNQALDELPIPSRPTPGSAPQSVATPPEGAPIVYNNPPAQIQKPLRPHGPSVPELFGRVLPGVLATGLGTTVLEGTDQLANRIDPPNRGPTPGSQTRSYSLPTPPSAPMASAPLPIVNPEIIELVRAVNRGEISLEQAEEFAREANRSETLDKSGVSALLQASRDRARGT